NDPMLEEKRDNALVSSPSDEQIEQAPAESSSAVQNPVLIEWPKPHPAAKPDIREALKSRQPQTRHWPLITCAALLLVGGIGLYYSGVPWPGAPDVESEDSLDDRIGPFEQMLTKSEITAYQKLVCVQETGAFTRGLRQAVLQH